MIEPTPTPEDRRKARLLAEAGNFDAATEDLFARGIAVARNGGDLRDYLREQVEARDPKMGEPEAFEGWGPGR